MIINLNLFPYQAYSSLIRDDEMEILKKAELFIWNNFEVDIGLIEFVSNHVIPDIYTVDLVTLIYQLPDYFYEKQRGLDLIFIFWVPVDRFTEP